MSNYSFIPRCLGFELGYIKINRQAEHSSAHKL